MCVAQDTVLDAFVSYRRREARGWTSIFMFVSFFFFNVYSFCFADKVLAVVRRATPVLFELVAREEEEMLRAAAERESRMGGGGEEETTRASSVPPVNEDEE